MREEKKVGREGKSGGIMTERSGETAEKRGGGDKKRVARKE